ncbi:MAG TPA: hypothetical protein DEF51_51195 [Myxococcales bacterium]|nr:hypothetical protein [Myxococcales bacterium]
MISAQRLEVRDQVDPGRPRPGALREVDGVHQLVFVVDVQLALEGEQGVGVGDVLGELLREWRARAEGRLGDEAFGPRAREALATFGGRVEALRREPDDELPLVVLAPDERVAARVTAAHLHHRPRPGERLPGGAEGRVGGPAA